MAEWDKLWKNNPGDESNEFPEWLEKVKAEGDILQREKRSLLTYGGMLRDENARLEQKLEMLIQDNGVYEQAILIHKAASEKLVAIRGVVAEYPKCDKTGLAFEWDELITRILAILDTPAQNTEVNHA